MLIYIGAAYLGQYATNLAFHSSISVSLVDGVGITDTLVRQVDFGRSVIDPIGILDLISRIADADRILLDDEAITDTLFYRLQTTGKTFLQMSEVINIRPSLEEVVSNKTTLREVDNTRPSLYSVGEN